jgi:signal transduction histidine kinase
MVQKLKQTHKNVLYFFKSNDKRNMIGLLGLFLLFAFNFASLSSFYVSKESLRDSIISQELPLTSDNIYSEIQKDLLLPIYISSSMANDTFLRDWVIKGEQNIDEIQKYLLEIKIKYQAVSSFFVSDLTKKYYYSDGLLKTVKKTEPRDKWFYRVKNIKRLYEINVDLDMANSDIITIFINYKVFDFAGQFIGATGVGLPVKTMKSRIDHYQNIYHRNIFFTNASGTTILADKSLNLQIGSKPNIKSLPGISTIADQILSQNHFNSSYELEGKTVLLSSRYIPELNWYLIVQQGEGEKLSAVREVLIINIIICVFATIVVLVIIGFLTNRYQNRLEKRNDELEEKNQQINDQKLLLESTNKRLEKLNTEKDEFLSIAAHDLKSPLNGITGMAQLILEDTSGDSNIKKFSELILSSSQAMSELISKLLDVRYIDSMQNPSMISTNFTLLVTEIVEQYQTIAAKKNIVLIPKISSTSIVILDFENWMYQVVTNLISNAIKFSPQGKQVEICLDQTEQVAQLKISDQGPGFSDKDKQSLYKRFSRLSAKPTANEGSTGLGLYIVKRIISQLGGSISCFSELGHGSSFTVTIPLDRK